MNLLFLSVLASISYSLADKVRYDDFSLFRFTPKDENAIRTLKEMEQSGSSGYDFWTSVKGVGTPVDILVPPQRKNNMKMLSKTFGMDVEVLMDNIQERIDEETSSLRADGEFGWDSYHNYDEICAWLKSLAKKHPGVVTLIEGGTTFEKRAILGVKVSFSPKNEFNSIWIDSNIHAREWIAGAVNTYILNALLTDNNIRDVVEAHDWYIFPVINPDGYQYTFTNDRLWRKTRTRNGLLCRGTDPNRNWNINWNEVGASSNPCSDLYAGPRPFSEPCTATLSEYISTIARKLMVYISFHSYTQLLLLPYGNTTDHLDNYDVTYPVGVKAVEVLESRYGTKYKVGNVAETICEFPSTNNLQI
ncbi:hypothetical protein JTB14_003715 [Gonioctena quinquepunctata]|nr:hypothetical protein JTB14_003715 [Gonioctena quinquepunctata]